MTNAVIVAGTSVVFSISEKDQNGNVVTVSAASLTATLSDPSLASAVINADGSEVTVTSTGKVGSVTLTVTDSHANISGTADVSVSSGPAATLTLDVVQPAPQATEAPQAPQAPQA